jgi:hypothetical protein
MSAKQTPASAEKDKPKGSNLYRQTEINFKAVILSRKKNTFKLLETDQVTLIVTESVHCCHSAPLLLYLFINVNFKIFKTVVNVASLNLLFK